MWLFGEKGSKDSVRKDTIEQLKSMYSHAKEKEKEWAEQFPLNSWNRGYIHGIVTAYGEIFENLCAFERANMFDDE